MFTTLLVQPLFNLLATIYAIVPGHDFGVAVIILTILVRIVLWPLVNKQLHSQRAMMQLQPEVARIKTQAKGDRQLESKLLMELYKEREISPFGSLLPLVIQLPIFIALYSVLRDVIMPGKIAKLAYPAVQHLGPIADILNHGVVFKPEFLGIVNLSQPVAIIAALAALAQFAQTKMLTPTAAKGDAQAQAVASMTYIFPFVTFFIGLSLPSALALYWVTTSAVAILQQYLVLKRDVVELEAEADIEAKAIGSAKKSKQAKK